MKFVQCILDTRIPRSLPMYHNFSPFIYLALHVHAHNYKIMNKLYMCVFLQTLEQEVSALQEQISALKSNSDQLEVANQNQLTELTRLRTLENDKKELEEELKVLSQKNTELQFQLSRLQKQYNEEGMAQQEELLGVLKSKLAKLHKEKAVWQDKEKGYVSEVENLKEEIAKLRKALTDSETMRTKLRTEYDAVLKELNSLRKQPAQDKDAHSFRDYVAVKRDLVVAREMNEELKQKIKIVQRGSGTLPHLKPEKTQPKSLTSSAKGTKPPPPIMYKS